jgi:cellulose biosynthesis protein BcsQ
MPHIYGFANKKGGQSKSTTTILLARLLVSHGAHVLIVDAAQPGTTTTAFRAALPETHRGLADLINAVFMAPRNVPLESVVRNALDTPLPLPLLVGDHFWLLPYDERLDEVAARCLRRDDTLALIFRELRQNVDIILIDYPTDYGPLMENCLYVTDRIIIPVAPAPEAIDGLQQFLHVMAEARRMGRRATLAGILITQAREGNGRFNDVCRALVAAPEIAGEHLRAKLFGWAVKYSEHFPQGFKFGQVVWDRTSDETTWAGYVLTAEWLLRDAGLDHLVERRSGPALLAPETLVLDPFSRTYIPWTAASKHAPAVMPGPQGPTRTHKEHML